MTDVRVVADAFGLDDLQGEPRLVSGGEQGCVWMVATRNGRWAVKQVSSPRSLDRIADAQSFASAAGHPPWTPRPRLTTDGAAVFDGAAVGAPDTWFRVMEWFDLDAERSAEASDLGRFAAEIHRVDCAATRDVEAWFASGSDDDVWDDLVARAHAARTHWAGDIQRRLPSLGRLRALTEAARPGRPLVSHRDLNLTNLRRTVSGDVVVIDWDMCGPIDPRRELALALVHLEVVSGAATEAYHAYVTSGGPARVDALDAFASVSIALDNLLDHYARQVLEDGPSSARARERLRWLLEMVDLVTVAWLERLLDRLTAFDG